MNKNIKLNISTSLASAVIVLILVCIFSYISAPESAGFWESINPVTLIQGLIFSLTWFGFPLGLSIFSVFAACFLLWFIFMKIIEWVAKAIG